MKTWNLTSMKEASHLGDDIVWRSAVLLRILITFLYSLSCIQCCSRFETRSAHKLIIISGKMSSIKVCCFETKKNLKKKWRTLEENERDKEKKSFTRSVYPFYLSLFILFSFSFFLFHSLFHSFPFLILFPSFFCYFSHLFLDFFL